MSSRAYHERRSELGRRMANVRWSQPQPIREETFEEIIGRFKDDRKGAVIAEGVTYSATSVSPWSVRHSTGHADQFDVVCDGRIVATAGKRSLPNKFIRKRARENAATCYADLS